MVPQPPHSTPGLGQDPGRVPCPGGHTHLDESGPAGLALVGFLSGVDACVGFQVGRPVELCPADVAAVRFFSCRDQQKGQGINTSDVPLALSQPPRATWLPLRSQHILSWPFGASLDDQEELWMIKPSSHSLFGYD